MSTITTTTSKTHHRATEDRGVSRWVSTARRGAVAGAAASLAMGMYAMAASATYQHHGLFTPLFHISALTGSPASMMTSVQQAMGGHRFWFTPGAAVAGAAIHMMTGAMFGVLFAAFATACAAHVPRRALPVVGAGFGLVAFAVSAWVLLPVAASLRGSGDVISKMSTMVGRPTFAVEHVIFGVALGAILMGMTNRRPGATRP